MQYDPSRQGYGNDGNQYLPMNQFSQPEIGNAYPPNNGPPLGTQYPPQPTGPSYYGQTSAQNTQSAAITSGYQQGNLVLTPVTSPLKIFLILSGSLYLVWGILGIGLDIGIVRNSTTFLYYCGFWGSGFFISGGVSMLASSSKTHYASFYLLQMLIATLVSNVLGLILSIVTLIQARPCDARHFICDDSLATKLKIALLLAFVIPTVHTIANILVIVISRKKTMVTST